MHTSAFPPCNNADANACVCYEPGHHNICEQLWNCVKRKTDVGGDGFLSPQGSEAVICWLSCLRLRCSPSHGRHLFIYLLISKQVHPAFFMGAGIFNANSALWRLSFKYNSNYYESQGEMLRVECHRWQNERAISLLVLLSSWDGNALLCIFVCACVYLEKKRCVHMNTHITDIQRHRSEWRRNV